MRFGTLLTAASAMSCSIAHAQQAPVFTPLGFVGGSPLFSEAHAVSRDGCVVGGFSSTAGPRAGFVWTPAAGMISVGGFPSAGTPSSQVTALSDDGVVAAGDAQAFPANISTAFRWTSSTGLEELGRTNLPTQQPLPTDARGMSGDGRVAVGNAGVSGSLFRRACRWDENGVIEILSGVPDRMDTWAYDASFDGSVVVGVSRFPSGVPGVGERYQAYRWTASGLELLGFLVQPPALSTTSATACSADGSIVFGYGTVNSPTRSFRWTPASGIADLDLNWTSFDTRVFACSARGDRAVGLTNTGTPRAFLWREGGSIRTIEDILLTDYGMTLPGWTLRSAEDISADGRVVVGYGTDPAGRTQAWALRLPRECEPDLTTSAMPGVWDHGIPNGVVDNEDFFFFLAQFATGNMCVADVTSSAVPGAIGYGEPDGLLNNEDFFYYLTLFAAGC